MQAVPAHSSLAGARYGSKEVGKRGAKRGNHVKAFSQIRLKQNRHNLLLSADDDHMLKTYHSPVKIADGAVEEAEEEPRPKMSGYQSGLRFYRRKNKKSQQFVSCKNGSEHSIEGPDDSIASFPSIANPLSNLQTLQPVELSGQVMSRGSKQRENHKLEGRSPYFSKISVSSTFKKESGKS